MSRDFYNSKNTQKTQLRIYGAHYVFKHTHILAKNASEIGAVWTANFSI